MLRFFWLRSNSLIYVFTHSLTDSLTHWWTARILGYFIYSDWCDMLHMTCNMWHVTCDMWHATCDRTWPDMTWHCMTCEMWYDITSEMWHDITCDMKTCYMWQVTNEKWKVTFDIKLYDLTWLDMIWHVICQDMWHETCDMLQVTSEMWQVINWPVTSDYWKGTFDMRHVTIDKWHMKHCVPMVEVGNFFHILNGFEGCTSWWYKWLDAPCGCYWKTQQKCG